MTRILTLIIFLITSVSCTLAQHKITEHIYKRDSTTIAPKGSLEDFDLLIGEWTGNDEDASYDELWMEPMNNAMHGIFRLQRNGEIEFTEYMNILEDSISYAMKIKHFSPDFEGWEEKDDAINFRFVKRESNILYLSGLTAERVDADNLIIYVAFRQEDDSVTEGKFAFTKKL